MWFFVLLIIGAFIYSRVFLFSSGKIVVTPEGRISPNAEIVNITHELEHWRRNTYIKTIVHFCPLVFGNVHQLEKYFLNFRKEVTNAIVVR